MTQAVDVAVGVGLLIALVGKRVHSHLTHNGEARGPQRDDSAAKISKDARELREAVERQVNGRAKRC